MSRRILGVVGLAITSAALAACTNGPRYVQSAASAPTTLLQQCVAYFDNGTPDNPADDYVEVVDDDYCEDRRHGMSWYYGGIVYQTNGHWYVRNGYRYLPNNALTRSRDPRWGGSSRTQGRVRSYNEVAAKRLGVTPSYQAKSSWGRNGAARSADDRRAAKSGLGGKGTTTNVTPKRSK